MTAPLSPAAPNPTPPPAPVPALPPPPATPVTFPLGWMLSNASPALQYRSIAEVARIPVEPGSPVAKLPLAHRPALELAMTQAGDGTWNRSMLRIPPERSHGFEGVGTISAVRRLVEYGWDRDTPPLFRSRRVLFRLLAEDADPTWLFDLAPKKQVDDDTAQRGRAILREASAAALAQMGYEGDPRLRGAATRIVERVNGYLRSPLAQKPWVRVGNKQVLPNEASPPSIFALTMLAFMPALRKEHHEAVDRIYQHVSQPLPRQDPVQLCGETLVEQPHLVLGDMLSSRNVVDADVPWALTWLELMARLGFLRRNESWARLFERFLDDRDRDGVWHPHRGTGTPHSSNPYAWPLFPLEDMARRGEHAADVTFRLGLIARLSGRQIDLV